jgi:hypothetical protein
VQAEIRAFGVVETKVLAAYNSAVKRAQTEHLPDGQLADLIASNVLPDWAAQRAKLAGLKGIQGPPQRAVALLVQYMEARQQAWELLVAALRQHNTAGVRNAMEKQREAEALVRQMNPAKH